MLSTKLLLQAGRAQTTDVASEFASLTPSNAGDAPERMFTSDAFASTRTTLLRDPHVGDCVRTFARAFPREALYTDVSPATGQRRPVTPTTQRQRFMHVPFMQNRTAREVMTAMAQRLLRQRSSSLTQRLATSSAYAQPYGWDVVVVGAGPHGVATALALRKRGLRVLVIERSDGVASTFNTRQFRLNSTAREPSSRSQQTAVERTPLGGWMRTGYMTGTRYPYATMVSQGETVQLAASDVDVLLDTQVTAQGITTQTRIGERPEYVVQLRNDALNGTAVAARAVVVATGLGRNAIPRLKTGMPLVRNLIDEVDKLSPAERRTYVPSILTVTQAQRLMDAQADGRKPYRNDGERTTRTMVVGRGDSSRVLLQALFGFGPEDNYTGGQSLDTNAAGALGNVRWLVGSNGPKDCAALLRDTQAPYLPLVPLAEKKLIDLMPSNIVDVEKTDDGLLVRYVDDAGQAGETCVDRLIFGTGFVNDTLNLLSVDLVFSERRPMQSAEVTSDGRARRVAQQLGASPVYLVGPCAGDLVDDDETFGTNANKVSLFATMPRTQRFAEMLATTLEAPSNTLRILPKVPDSPQYNLARSPNATLVRRVDMQARRSTAATPLIVQATLRDKARASQARSKQRVEVVFRLAGTELRVQGPNVLAQALRRDDDLCHSLAACMRGAGSNTATWRLRFNAEGRCSTDTLVWDA